MCFLSEEMCTWINFPVTLIYNIRFSWEVYFWTDLYFPFVHSCVRGTDNLKHENEIELFDEIDENVSFLEFTHDCFVFGINWKAHFFIFSALPGIQTQTHRSLGDVLFTKSAARQGVAKANEGQGEGELNPGAAVRVKFTFLSDWSDEPVTFSTADLAGYWLQQLEKLGGWLGWGNWKIWSVIRCKCTQ